MKAFIGVILLITVTANSYGQDWPVKKAVTDKKAKKVSFKQIPAFRFSADKVLTGRGVYQEIILSNSFSKKLLDERPEALKLSIPISSTENIICELVKFSLGNIQFTENAKDDIQNVSIPVTYRGIVAGEQGRNNVILTVNENYLSLVATYTDKALMITKADETDPSIYRLYNSTQVQFPAIAFTCGTTSRSSSALVNTAQTSSSTNRADSSQDKCVNVFVECFDSLYIWRGRNRQQTIDYVYELFSAVATGYANERVNIQLTTINIWTTPDPYRGNSRDSALADLAANYKDTFWGNICVGLDYSTTVNGRSGIAAAIGRVKAVAPLSCPAYTVNDNPFCYNDLNYTTIATGTANFPVGPTATPAAIYLVMHEVGHLLGVRHTKWCGWKLSSNPDVYGALDSCGPNDTFNVTIPLCPQGPPPPASGATIMSYCVGSNSAVEFVNFNNGFGALPGAALRKFVDETACIPGCLECNTLLNSGNRNTYALRKSAPEDVAASKAPPQLQNVLPPLLIQQPYWQRAVKNNPSP